MSLAFAVALAAYVVLVFALAPPALVDYVM